MADRTEQPAKIDIHTHIIPGELPDLCERYGCDDFIRMERVTPCCARLMRRGKLFREIGANCWDPSVRMQECDQTGVTMQALSTIPVLFSYWAKPEHAHDFSRLLNDHIAGVVRDHPDRFCGLGTLPMQSPELAIREMERCVNELGLQGVEIGSHIERADEPDWNLNAPQVFEVLQAAQDMDAAVFVHPWDMMGQHEIPEYWMPWLVGMPAETSRAICSMIFGGVFERLPSLRICFAHGGGAFPATVGRIEQGYKARPDLCAVDTGCNPRDFLGRFYVDSLVHDPDALRLVLKIIGEDRVALGSDYPFPLGEQCPGRMIESMSDLSDHTRRRILAENAVEFLGLELPSRAASGAAG